jgi:formate--tetrahydrofolate ligase
MPNLLQHVENITKIYKLPAVVAINAFPKDTKAEIELVENKCKELGVNVAVSEVWEKGGEGGIKLAEEVIRLCEEPNNFEYSYDIELSINEKIESIAKKIYHADSVIFLANAQKSINQIEKMGLDKVPVCMAKTQYSFSDDSSLLGAPKGWQLTVRDVKISAGAGFIVVFTGEIMTMPGLPPVPSAEKIDIDSTGKISGLF